MSGRSYPNFARFSAHAHQKLDSRNHHSEYQNSHLLPRNQRNRWKTVWSKRFYHSHQHPRRWRHCQRLHHHPTKTNHGSFRVHWTQGRLHQYRGWRIIRNLRILRLLQWPDWLKYRHQMEFNIRYSKWYHQKPWRKHWPLAQWSSSYTHQQWRSFEYSRNSQRKFRIIQKNYQFWATHIHNIRYYGRYKRKSQGNEGYIIFNCWIKWINNCGTLRRKKSFRNSFKKRPVP